MNIQNEMLKFCKIFCLSNYLYVNFHEYAEMTMLRYSSNFNPSLDIHAYSFIVKTN